MECRSKITQRTKGVSGSTSAHQKRNQGTHLKAINRMSKST